MRLLFILLVLSIFNPSNAVSQSLESIYSGKERKADVDKITEKYGGLKSDFISESELKFFLKNNVFDNEPLRDSLAAIRINELYYYSSGDVVGGIHNGLKLLTIYSKYCNSSELEAANRKVAEAYFATNNYVLARQFFLESLKYKFDEQYPYVYAQIGSTYLKNQELDEAILWYQKSVKVSKTPIHKVAHLNSLGYVHYLNKDYNAAEDVLMEAQATYFRLKNQVNELQLLIIKSNLASLFLVQEQNEKGLQYLKEIVSTGTFEKVGNWFKYEIYFKYIEGYLAIGNCSMAKEYLENLESALPINPLDGGRLKFIEIKMNVLSSCGGSQGLAPLFKSYLAKEDSISDKEDLRYNIVQNIQRSVYKDQIDLVSMNLSLKEESESTLELANTRLRRLFWISGVLFFVIVFFFVIRFRQNRLKRDLILEKEKSTGLSIKMAEQQIENKKLELSKILTNIDKSSSLSEEVLARLSILKQKDGDIKDDISQLIQFINSMSRTNSLNELVEKNSDVLGFGLKERIEKKFPNLTPSELQLIILIRIGLSTKEVAQLKNVEPTSVRIFKHRLKVKLNVSKELDLNRFVSEL